MVKETIIDPQTGRLMGQLLQTNGVAVSRDGRSYGLWIGTQLVSASHEQIAALRELLNSPEIYEESGHANH